MNAKVLIEVDVKHEALILIQAKPPPSLEKNSQKNSKPPAFLGV
jgi:hypothetical protein